MPGIFVFTAGNQAAKAHLRDSIINPVNSNIIFDSFDETYHPQLQQVLDEESGFFAWGAIPGIRNNPTWKALKINDWVFCVYGGAYHFISRVKAKFDNYN